MTDVILIAILIVIAGGIIWYLLRAKKKGQTCVGCPHAGKCSGGCGKN